MILQIERPITNQTIDRIEQILQQLNIQVDHDMFIHMTVILRNQLYPCLNILNTQLYEDLK